MSDQQDDDRTLDEIHQREGDPFTDRQNLEPEPSTRDVAEAQEESMDSVGTGAESDIREFVAESSDDDPTQEAPRNHDDDDPWGDGVEATSIAKRYEDMATRDDLAREVEELVATAYEWYSRSSDDDAQEIYETLLSVAERLGNPAEETTRTEPGPLPADQDQTDP